MFACIETYDRFYNSTGVFEVDDKLIEQALELGAITEHLKPGSDIVEMIDDFLEDKLPDLNLRDEVIDLLTELVYGDYDEQEDGTISMVAEGFVAGIGRTKKDAMSAYMITRLDADGGDFD